MRENLSASTVDPPQIHVGTTPDLPWLERVQIIIILSYFGLFALASYVLTVEPDEAWTLLSTYKAFGIAVPDTSAVANPTVTSGGLHALIHGLLGLLSTDIRLHRSISLLALGSLLAVTFTIFKRCGAARAEASAGCLLVLNSAGLALQSSLATAEIIATALLVVALWTLTHLEVTTQKGTQFPPTIVAVLSAILLGLTFATRINCIVVLPYVMIFCLMLSKTRREKLLILLLVCGTSLIVTVFCITLYIVSFGGFNLHRFTAYMSRSTGVGYGAKGFDGVLHGLVVGNDLVPYAALALLILVYWLRGRTDRSDRGFVFGTLLLGCGCLNLLFWLAISPISHVRYLYPGIPMLWLAAGLVALSGLRRSTRDFPVTACHTAIILLSLASLLMTFRYVAAGDSLTAVYQFARQVPLVFPRELFQASHDQRRTADFVRALPPSSHLLSFLPEAAYPITYLSRRPIGSVARDWILPGPKFILFVPNQTTIWPIREAFTVWLNENTSMVFRSGDYVVYAIREAAPQPKR